MALATTWPVKECVTRGYLLLEFVTLGLVCFVLEILMNYQRCMFSSSSKSTLSNFYQGAEKLKIWDKTFISS